MNNTFLGFQFIFLIFFLVACSTKPIKKKVIKKIKPKKQHILYEAAKNESLLTVKRLELAKVDLTEDFLNNILHEAILRKHYALAELVILRGANVNSQKNDGLRALDRLINTKCLSDEIKNNLFAVKQNEKPSIMIQSLIKEDLSFKETIPSTYITNQMKPVTSKSQFTCSRLLDFIISKGADLKIGDYGSTPLHEAVKNGYFQLAQKLIAKGASIKIKDLYGKIPLHWAAMGGFIRLTKLFILLKSPIEAKDNFGQTPLFEAVKNSQSKTASILIQNGANVNTRSRYYYLIHEAIDLVGKKPGAIEIVKLLLKSEANLNNKNYFGVSTMKQVLIKAVNNPFFSQKEGKVLLLELIVELKKGGVFISTEDITYSKKVLKDPIILNILTKK